MQSQPLQCSVAENESRHLNISMGLSSPPDFLIGNLKGRYEWYKTTVGYEFFVIL